MGQEVQHAQRSVDEVIIRRALVGKPACGGDVPHQPPAALVLRGHEDVVNLLEGMLPLLAPLDQYCDEGQDDGDNRDDDRDEVLRPGEEIHASQAID